MRKVLTRNTETIPMGTKPEAQPRPEGDRRPFYIVWGPEGGDPVVRFPTFEGDAQVRVTLRAVSLTLGVSFAADR